MRGNAAIIKCLIPSFVADFVQVVAWISEDGEEFKSGSDMSDGKLGIIISFVGFLTARIMKNNKFRQNEVGYFLEN